LAPIILFGISVSKLPFSGKRAYSTDAMSNY
jgi:hypothetical protein